MNINTILAAPCVITTASDSALVFPIKVTSNYAEPYECVHLFSVDSLYGEFLNKTHIINIHTYTDVAKTPHAATASLKVRKPDGAPRVTRSVLCIFEYVMDSKCAAIILVGAKVVRQHIANTKYT